ncbi:hypothetical protein [Streptomyces sp. HPF1205]|uniref:hypothetical protein n=1 Tax=Streptomyces sp. HPF1205 TaxID=2873262 RepID=UPI001CECD849|nr:hypothetical protein [Streptomyces sp. HPF1205]
MTRTTSRTTTAAATAVRAGLSVAALAASGALLLTACSSSSSGTASASGSPSGSVSAAASASGNGAQEMQAYRTCLSQHGLNLPTFARRSPGAGRPSGSPGAGRGGGGGRGSGGGYGGGYGGGFPGFGGGTPDAATQKALDACASLRPRFNGRGGGANSTAFKAFTSCLKDHGVVLPTPSPGASNGSGRPGFGPGFGGPRGLNTADPKTAKAYETCRALLPQRPSGAASPSPAATT